MVGIDIVDGRPGRAWFDDRNRQVAEINGFL
jgi:hypothetical protein